MKTLNSKHASSEKRTADIIQAALECFTSSGLTDTSMADICATANASTGSVYHHFKSKEQLAAAVYLKGIEAYQSGMIRTIIKETDAFKGITAVIRYHLKWIQVNRDWAQFLFQKRHSSFLEENEDKLSSLNREFMKTVSGWFDRHIEAGTIRHLKWDLLLSLLMGPCEEYTKFYLSNKTVTKIDEAVKELSLSVWRSLANNQ